MESSQQSQGSDSQATESTDNVKAKNVPPLNTSPKKPIQLGVVQSSSGIRSSMGNLLKKSRWDQAPQPDEEEEAVQNQDDKSSSVKSLIKKFEDITGVSKCDDVVQNKKEDSTKSLTSSTPSRVKLVRTNFMRTEKSLLKSSNTTDDSNSSSDIVVSNPNDEVDNEFKKEETNKHLTKESTDSTDKPEVSEIVPVAASKALQIISSCYDSPTDESSQEGPLPSTDNTPVDSAYASLENDGEHSNKNNTNTFLHETKDLDSNTKMEIDNEHEQKEPISKITSTVSEEIDITNSLDRTIDNNLTHSEGKEQSTNSSFHSESNILTDNVFSNEKTSAHNDTLESSKTLIPKDNNCLNIPMPSANENITHKFVLKTILKDENVIESHEHSQTTHDKMITECLNDTETKEILQPTSELCKLESELEHLQGTETDEIFEHTDLITEPEICESGSEKLIQIDKEHVRNIQTDRTDDVTQSECNHTKSKLNDKLSTNKSLDGDVTIENLNKTSEGEIFMDEEDVDDNNKISGNPSRTKEPEILEPTDSVTKSITCQADSDNNKITPDRSSKYPEDLENLDHTEPGSKFIIFDSESENIDKLTTEYPSKTQEGNIMNQIEPVSECISSESEGKDATEITSNPNVFNEGAILELTESVPEYITHQSSNEDDIEITSEIPVKNEEDDNKHVESVGNYIPLATESEDIKTGLVNKTEKADIIEQIYFATECIPVESKSEDAVEMVANNADKTNEDIKNKNKKLATECLTIESNSEDNIKMTMNPRKSAEDKTTEQTQSILENETYQSKMEDTIETATKLEGETIEDSVNEYNEFVGDHVSLETESEDDNKTTMKHLSKTKSDEIIEQSNSVVECLTKESISEDVIKKDSVENEQVNINKNSEFANECLTIQSTTKDDTKLTMEYINENLEEDINDRSESGTEHVALESKSEDIKIDSPNLVEEYTVENKIIETFNIVNDESTKIDLEISSKIDDLKIEQLVPKQNKIMNTVTDTAQNDMKTDRKIEEGEIMEIDNLETADASLENHSNQKLVLKSQIDCLPEESNSTNKISWNISPSKSSVNQDDLLMKHSLSSELKQCKQPSKTEKTDDSFTKRDIEVSGENSSVLLKDDVIVSIEDENIRSQTQNVADNESTTDIEVTYDDGVDATMEKMFSDDLISLEFDQSNKNTEDAEQLSQKITSTKVPASADGDEDTNQFEHHESNDNLLEVLEADNSENSNDNFDEIISETNVKETLHTTITEKTKSVAPDITPESGEHFVDVSEEIDIESKNTFITDMKLSSNEMSTKLLDSETKSKSSTTLENTKSIEEKINKGDSTTTSDPFIHTVTSDNTMVKSKYTRDKVVIENLGGEEFNDNIKSYALEIMPVSSNNDVVTETIHLNESLDTPETNTSPKDNPIKASKTEQSNFIENKIDTIPDIVDKSKTVSEDILPSTQMKEVTGNIDEKSNNGVCGNKVLDSSSEQKNSTIEDINNHSESSTQNHDLPNKIFTDNDINHQENIVVSENVTKIAEDELLNIKQADEFEVPCLNVSKHFLESKIGAESTDQNEDNADVHVSVREYEDKSSNKEDFRDIKVIDVESDVGFNEHLKTEDTSVRESFTNNKSTLFENKFAMETEMKIEEKKSIVDEESHIDVNNSTFGEPENVVNENITQEKSSTILETTNQSGTSKLNDEDLVRDSHKKVEQTANSDEAKNITKVTANPPSTVFNIENNLKSAVKNETAENIPVMSLELEVGDKFVKENEEYDSTQEELRKEDPIGAVEATNFEGLLLDSEEKKSACVLGTFIEKNKDSSVQENVNLKDAKSYKVLDCAADLNLEQVISFDEGNTYNIAKKNTHEDDADSVTSLCSPFFENKLASDIQGKDFIGEEKQIDSLKSKTSTVTTKDEENVNDKDNEHILTENDKETTKNKHKDTEETSKDLEVIKEESSVENDKISSDILGITKTNINKFSLPECSEKSDTPQKELFDNLKTQTEAYFDIITSQTSNNTEDETDTIKAIDSFLEGTSTVDSFRGTATSMEELKENKNKTHILKTSSEKSSLEQNELIITDCSSNSSTKDEKTNKSIENINVDLHDTKIKYSSEHSEQTQSLEANKPQSELLSENKIESMNELTTFEKNADSEIPQQFKDKLKHNDKSEKCVLVNKKECETLLDEKESSKSIESNTNNDHNKLSYDVSEGKNKLQTSSAASIKSQQEHLDIVTEFQNKESVKSIKKEVCSKSKNSGTNSEMPTDSLSSSIKMDDSSTFLDIHSEKDAPNVDFSKTGENKEASSTLRCESIEPSSVNKGSKEYCATDKVNDSQFSEESQISHAGPTKSETLKNIEEPFSLSKDSKQDESDIKNIPSNEQLQSNNLKEKNSQLKEQKLDDIPVSSDRSSEKADSSTIQIPEPSEVIYSEISSSEIPPTNLDKTESLNQCFSLPNDSKGTDSDINDIFPNKQQDSDPLKEDNSHTKELNEDDLPILTDKSTVKTDVCTSKISELIETTCTKNSADLETTRGLKRPFSLTENSKGNETDTDNTYSNKQQGSVSTREENSQLKKSKLDDIPVSIDKVSEKTDTSSSEILKLNENLSPKVSSHDETPAGLETTRVLNQLTSLSDDSKRNASDIDNTSSNTQPESESLKEDNSQLKEHKLQDIPTSVGRSHEKTGFSTSETSELTETACPSTSSPRDIPANLETSIGLKKPLILSEDSKKNETDISNISPSKLLVKDNRKEDNLQPKDLKLDNILTTDKLTDKTDTLTTQIPEQLGKPCPKTSSPKEIPAPVRVSARQKQRQAAAAAALAADQKGKSVPDPLTKKGVGSNKNLDKQSKKSLSPSKELQVKICSPKSTDSEKQSSPLGQKSPKTTDYKASSQVSPKKLIKDVGRDKLEPITLKLSKEDNPVIIRSSSLSPKRVLSPLSPQTKTLGYTLKIGKDSTTIIPKDPTLSPKLRDSSPNTSTSKVEISEKVGYMIKDPSLTITPISPQETQDQKLSKITLKLSKAGGHPEIKQEKHETWKAIKKLGEIDIVPVEGKVSSDVVKKKEKSELENPEKKLKLGEVTVEPSSSNLSKLQGLLTQAPLNQSDDSNDVQFVGFAPTSDKTQSPQPMAYDIGLVKQEPDSQNSQKRRGRPRKMLSPGDMTHSISQSIPPGLTAKDILAASLQHQTLQQHIQQLQQPMQYVPPQEECSSGTMFPVPLFDLSEDTFMDPSPPTIFPDQVQPEMIMRSARGRPIGRSRRSRGSGLLRASERGPRGRPRGSRGLKRMLAEMEALAYPDMEQPITLDNIDSEIGPREHTVSQITETTMALLRKSIEGKSLEKRARKSDGSEDENRDRELDAKVREMKEKIEAAYQAELRSPGKVTPEKDQKKKTPERSELRDFRKSPPELIPLSLKGDKINEEDSAKLASPSFSGIMDRESFKRKSTDENLESSQPKKICEENNQISFSTEGDSESLTRGSEFATNQMEVNELNVPESQEGVKSEPEPPPKPVKPRPKSKAEIKRIKREKDRIRREAKKLAALEALKAPPPNPCEEDTRMSATDPNCDGDDPLGTGIKKNRMEVGDPEGKEFTVEQIAEYQWPLQGGELYMIQEQISTYLGVKSFKRKYPDLKRRPVEMEERTFLCDSGLVSESMCDLGLTAVSSSEVLDIMFQDFQDQYEELRKHMREKQARELINKQKEKKKFELSLSKSDLKEQAIQSSISWNQALNKSRTESRKCHLDLQTWTIQYPRNRAVKMTKPTPKLGSYPVALIPGQYADYYKRYTPQELRYWPVNTVLYGPLQPNERHSTGGSEGSQSESEDSSSSDDSSDSSSEGEEDCKVCGGGKRSGGAIQCSHCGHNSTTASVWA